MTEAEPRELGVSVKRRLSPSKARQSAHLHLRSQAIAGPKSVGRHIDLCHDLIDQAGGQNTVKERLN